MSDIEIIEAPKQLAIAAQLAGISSEFQRTGGGRMEDIGQQGRRAIAFALSSICWPAIVVPIPSPTRDV